MLNRYSGLSLVVSLLIVSILFYRQVVYSNSAYDFPAHPVGELVQSSTIKFEEMAMSMGLTSVFQTHWPNPHIQPITKKLRRIPPSIATADLNNDGYVDIVVADGEQRSAGLTIYKNIAGTRFENVTEKWLGDIQSEAISTILALADFNNDGYQDIFVGRYGKHSLYLWNPSEQKFTDNSTQLNGYFSNPESVSVADFNQDGLLDIFIGNYYPEMDLRFVAPPKLPFIARGDLKTGGRNVLLLNQDGSFVVSSIFPFQHAAHTIATGVADLNKDGFPEIFEGNEYAPDFIYLNQGGKTFVENTEEIFPISEHGFSSMNSEFFDFNFDGELELYVTNISSYPVLGRGNILWQKAGENRPYKNMARSMKVAHCGFAWAAKFADFDLDGANELYVLNGGYSGASPSASSYWYFQSLRDSIPVWMRGVPSRIDEVDFNRSGYEKDCLFKQAGDHFQNIAPMAGMADMGDGRGLALADFNNDGLADALVANQTGPIKLYLNLSEPKMNWVGIELIAKNGSKVPYGVRLEGSMADGRKIYRELYPLNGHNGQSDPRYIFAVGGVEDIRGLEIHWPGGAIQPVQGLELNKYTTVKQAM